MQIELALRSAQLIGLKQNSSYKMSYTEAEEAMQKQIQDLYDLVSGYEPKSESEVL